MAIEAVGQISQVSKIVESAGGKSGGDAFKEVLNEVIEQVNQTESDSNQSVAQLVNGQSDNLHSQMIALEKADIALSLAVTVRNKAIEAYQEIMRMQI